MYSFISLEKYKEKASKIYLKHVIENLFLLFEVIALEHVGTQGKMTGKHVST